MAQRLVTSFVPRTAMNPVISRLIGGLDFKGQGTDHPLLGLDPFVLCDAAPELHGIGKPPFAFHPHHGLIAITYVLEGSFQDEDNLSSEKHINSKGSIYMVAAGRGLMHSEKAASEGLNGAMQTIVRIPQDKLGIAPAICRVPVGDIPILDLAGGVMHLLVGQNAGLRSPAYLEAMPRFILSKVEVSPGSTVYVPLDDDLEHGFVHVLSGGATSSTIGRRNIESEGGVYLFETGGMLEISHADAADSPLQIFLGAGMKLDEPWVKLLGHNGFIIAKDEIEAEKVMAKIDERGKDFTYRDLL